MVGGMPQEEAENQAPSMLAVRELLRKWEAVTRTMPSGR